jgi:hypothetical protein
MKKTAKTKMKETAAEDEKLMADLQKYQKMALEMGADKAEIVPISDIVQRIRARMADIFPRCDNIGFAYFGMPNFEIPWKYSKAILASYHYAIVAHILYPPGNPNDFTGPTAVGLMPELIAKYKKYWPAEEVEYWQAVEKRRQGKSPSGQAAIAELIEKTAREDGHQFAFSGLSAGCLKFCGEKFGWDCLALRTGICRNPGKSRPYGTAAAMGIDHPAVYAKLGWQNCVQGWSVFPEDYPDGPITPPPARTSIIFID